MRTLEFPVPYPFRTARSRVATGTFMKSGRACRGGVAAPPFLRTCRGPWWKAKTRFPRNY